MGCRFHYNTLLTHFIYAGGSALLLCFAYTLADLWFFYLFALAPFMFRISESDLRGSIIAALLLGLSIALVVFPGVKGNLDLEYFFSVLLLCLTFVLFSAALNRLKRYFKFGLLLAGVLCFPLEYFHKTVLDLDSTFLALKWDSGFIFRTASLSGIVFVALLLIAFNSLLLLLMEIAFGLIYSVSFYQHYQKGTLIYVYRNPLPSLTVCILPDQRGPPRI